MIIWLTKLMGFIPESVQRLFSYVSFRALMAMLTAFIFGVFVGKKLINIIYQLNFRDTSRNYGDLSPKNKTGTPTMGGIIIFLSFLIAVLIWSKPDNFFISIILLAGFWFTTMGFFDDYLKNVKGTSDAGMSRGLKIFLQSLFGLILGLLVLSSHSPISQDIATKLYIPFVKNPLIDLSFFYYIFIILVVVAISNSINFADGLDGLAVVPVSLVAFVYAVFAYILGNSKLAEYLIFPYISGAEELVIALAALVGAMIGFLWFNTYPAEIFMGDTGSLFFGGHHSHHRRVIEKGNTVSGCGGTFCY